jgi:mannose-6-phosphate isomerase
MLSDLPPFLPMRPHLVEKVWGGRKLARHFNKDLPAGLLIGESWEVADLPEGQSHVARGPLAGWPLNDLVQAHRAELLGPGDASKRFPLLIKILDASADLSVQVHPGTGDLNEDSPHRPKDECWIDLGSESGAQVLHGLVSGATRQSFESALAAKLPQAALRAVHLEKGECLRIPPGTLHAIGAGSLLLEVQLPSDTTFRVWDYERPGLDGKPRALHVQEALEVIHFGEQPPLVQAPTPLKDGHACLVDVPSYRVERVQLTPGLSHRALATRPDAPLCVIITQGAVILRRGEEELEASLGESLIVPAQLDGFVVESRGEGPAEMVVASRGGDALLS